MDPNKHYDNFMLYVKLLNDIALMLTFARLHGRIVSILALSGDIQSYFGRRDLLEKFNPIKPPSVIELLLLT